MTPKLYTTIHFPATFKHQINTKHVPKCYMIQKVTGTFSPCWRYKWSRDVLTQPDRQPPQSQQHVGEVGAALWGWWGKFLKLSSPQLSHFIMLYLFIRKNMGKLIMMTVLVSHRHHQHNPWLFLHISQRFNF